MEKDGYSLTREFSHLGRFQQAHTLCYALDRQEERLAVRLTCTRQKEQETQQISLVDWTLEEARLLVRYLYENAVPMENWQDVVTDLTVSLTPRKG